MNVRRRHILAGGLFVASVSSAATLLLSSSPSPAASVAHYRLNPGDYASLPVIGWTCSFAVTPPGAAFACTPGQAGTSTQGEPIVSIQQGQLVVFGGARPRVKALPVPRATLYIYTFPVRR